jgi:hypothetical protein
MLTPAMVHHGEAKMIITKRELVMAEAFQRNPERFVKEMPRVQ